MSLPISLGSQHAALQPVPENPEQETPAEQPQKQAETSARKPLKCWLLSAAVLLLAGMVASGVAYYRLTKRVDRQLATGALGEHTHLFRRS